MTVKSTSLKNVMYKKKFKNCDFSYQTSEDTLTQFIKNSQQYHLNFHLSNFGVDTRYILYLI